MARQRFIHPEIWKDPVFGRLTPQEQVLFIGLFSIADDDGRLNADPAYLSAELFTYKDFTNKKVQTIRDAVVSKVPSVHLYRGRDTDLIALLKWKDYQKPKYAKPSKLPPPFLPDEAALALLSAKAGSSLGEASPKSVHGLGLGRDGLDRAVSESDSELPTSEQEPRPSIEFPIPNLKEVKSA